MNSIQSNWEIFDFSDYIHFKYTNAAVFMKLQSQVLQPCCRSWSTLKSQTLKLNLWKYLFVRNARLDITLHCRFAYLKLWNKSTYLVVWAVGTVWCGMSYSRYCFPFFNVSITSQAWWEVGWNVSWLHAMNGKCSHFHVRSSAYFFLNIKLRLYRTFITFPFTCS